MSEFKIGDKVCMLSDDTLVEGTVTAIFGDAVRLEELVRRVPGSIMVDKSAIGLVNQLVDNAVE